LASHCTGDVARAAHREMWPNGAGDGEKAVAAPRSATNAITETICIPAERKYGILLECLGVGKTPSKKCALEEGVDAWPRWWGGVP
jgi:hypothetical protein